MENRIIGKASIRSESKFITGNNAWIIGEWKTGFNTLIIDSIQLRVGMAQKPVVFKDGNFTIEIEENGIQFSDNVQDDIQFCLEWCKRFQSSVLDVMLEKELPVFMFCGEKILIDVLINQ